MNLIVCSVIVGLRCLGYPGIWVDDGESQNPKVIMYGKEVRPPLSRAPFVWGTIPSLNTMGILQKCLHCFDPRRIVAAGAIKTYTADPEPCLKRMCGANIWHKRELLHSERFYCNTTEPIQTRICFPGETKSEIRPCAPLVH